MTVETKRNLVLIFKTAGDKEVKLTINAPKTDLEDSVIAAAMDEIITSNAYGHEEVVATKDSAKYVIQQEQAISLA